MFSYGYHLARGYKNINTQIGSISYVFSLSSHAAECSENANFAWSANWKYLHNKLHNMRFLRWSSARRANVLLKSGHQGRIAICARGRARRGLYFICSFSHGRLSSYAQYALVWRAEKNGPHAENKRGWEREKKRKGNNFFMH